MLGSLLFYTIFAVGLITLCTVAFIALYIYTNPKANALFFMAIAFFKHSQSQTRVEPCSRPMFTVIDEFSNAKQESSISTTPDVQVKQIKRPQKLEFVHGFLIDREKYAMGVDLDNVFDIPKHIDEDETLILLEQRGNMYAFSKNDTVPRHSLNTNNRMSEKFEDEVRKTYPHMFTNVMILPRVSLPRVSSRYVTHH